MITVAAAVVCCVAVAADTTVAATKERFACSIELMAEIS